MKKIVYVSPVCHLDEVAAQMGVICMSGEETPIKNPGETSNPSPTGGGVKSPKIA